MGQYDVSAGVIILLSTGSPSAILGTVIAVYVDSVYRIGGTRLTPHVSQEVLEARGTKPSLADTNASATVINVTTVIRSQTPSLKFAPASVLGSVT
jgi:hypothetical protein